jgi:hypothetical protein
MLIADAVAIGRAAQRCHAFHEAGRQTPKAAIPQRRIGLIPDHRAQIDPKAAIASSPGRKDQG